MNMSFHQEPYVSRSLFKETPAAPLLFYDCVRINEHGNPCIYLSVQTAIPSHIDKLIITAFTSMHSNLVYQS